MNLTTAGTVGTSIGIAVGNTLEGLLGAYFVNRLANGRRVFDRPQDVLKFAVLAGLVCTMVDLGVKCESSHFDMKELRENLTGRIAWARDVGLTQMMVPSLDGPRNPTMDDAKRAADEYNKIGGTVGQGRYSAGPSQ